MQPQSEDDAPSDQHTDTLEDTEQDSATDCGSEHTFRSTFKRNTVISFVSCNARSTGKKDDTYFGRQEYHRSGNPR